MKHFIFLSFLFFNHLLSQNLLNNQDAKDILKQTGLTKNQAKTILQKEGIKVPNDKKATSFDNSQFLKEEQVSDDIIRDIELINEQNKSIVDELDQGDMDDKEKINIDDIDNNSLNIIEEDILFDEIIEPTYFGYDVFENDPEIFQESLDNNIDPNYVVGPGDEIIIMLWGETELNQPFIISREGYLFIPNIGQVFVNGLTLAKLEVKLFKLLKKVYSSLESKTGQVSTFFDISLGALVLRPLRIFALGEIEQPGAYSVKPSTTLFTSLYFFNGPTIEGSLRTIKLIRSEKEVGAIDFYDFLLTGKKTNDIQLQRDDVVFIPPRGKTVTVRGEINRQAIYELKDNEGLKSLIEISGGLKTTTYMDRVQIDRILSPLDRKSFRMDRTIVDVRLNDILDSKKDFPLLDGDEITFFKISDVRLNTVTLYGAVQRPGIYGLGTGMKLKDLINKSDGLSGDAYLDEAIIYRKYIDLTEEHIRVNLKEVLAGDALNNISLLSNDEVTIYSTTDMRFTNDLTITGHVMYPGVKPFRKGMTVYDLIFLGGGFENEEHMKNTYVDRADLIRFNDNDFSKTMQSFRLDSVLAGRGLSNFDLKMGDEIIIYTKKDILGYFDQIVYADGFVKNPGEFQLYENMRVLDLLFLAGGVEDDAHFKNIYFDRADLVRNDNNLDVKNIIRFNLKSILDNPKDENNRILQHDDVLRIYSKDVFNENPVVSIIGDINDPGEYDLKSGMTLKDLILEAGGVTENVYKYRVEISRINPLNKDEDKFSDIIIFELNNDFTIFTESGKNLNKNSLLKPYDLIIIRPDPYFNIQRTVLIEGNIYYPGEYVLRGPNEKVTDIIERAGGLRPEAHALASRLIRDDKEISLSFEKIIKNPRSRLNFNLIEGDIISIGGKTNLVIIEGAVNSPGNYQFIKGSRLNDYIKMAGGYHQDAARYGVFVKYPDGTSKKRSIFNLRSPLIRDGSTITIPGELEVEPFNFTEYVTNLTTIWADMTQAYLLIMLSFKQ